MITLQFVSAADPVSWAVQWGTHGWCSHVDCVMLDGTLLGARARGGVLIRKPDYAAFNRIARVTFGSHPIIEGLFLQFLRQQIGKPYDYTALMGNFVGNRDWREPDSWFCSELIAAALEVAGFFTHTLAAPSQKIAPADLLLALSAVADYKVEIMKGTIPWASSFVTSKPAT